MAGRRDENQLARRLSSNVASRRRALSLTQAQLAEALGVDVETLSRFERGKHLPSLRTLEKLADLLHVPISELLDNQPAELPADAVRVAAALAPLETGDRKFLLAQLKAGADHMRKRRA